MSGWTDSHNHLQDPRLGKGGSLVATMRSVGISRCAVNATCESDWEAVEQLACDYPEFIVPAFGIHPWHAAGALPGWQTRLRRLLEKHPRSSIGECGLDGWVASPSPAIQEPVFLDQLRLANELDRPVTIHCLKAWHPLFDAFKQVPPPPRFLMHSFGGSRELAERLLPLGASFSCSGYFLQPRKAAALEIFRQLPPDRLLVETDAPDMTPSTEWITHPLPDRANHPANLPQIGQGLAAAFGIDPATLAARTAANHRRFFNL